ncbi:hypothetical protein Lal_00001714 [Lupinus albus]|nr:hypothetical protein Lal_00001714 [Lupinus albus]
MGSPPPAGSEKVVLKFRSVNNIVIAPASTGSDNKSGNAVTGTDHTKRGDLCIVIPGPRMLEIVTVHPVPLPTSTKAELNRSKRLGGNNQNEILFNRGNAMSGAPIRIGTDQLPDPPIIAGITIKKIIKKA